MSSRRSPPRWRCVPCRPRRPQRRLSHPALAGADLYRDLHGRPGGAEVTSDGQTGTHTEGRWVFALPDGTYSYSVRAFGYLEKTGELTVQGGTVDESVTLAAAARRSVTFTVTRADANAAVTVLWNGQAVAPESDGSYSLPTATISISSRPRATPARAPTSRWTRAAPQISPSS